jgi:hypothetical protein
LVTKQTITLSHGLYFHTRGQKWIKWVTAVTKHQNKNLFTISYITIEKTIFIAMIVFSTLAHWAFANDGKTETRKHMF